MIRHLLNRTLTVHRIDSSADDGMGGQTVSRSQVGTVRAQVNQPGAEDRERILAQQASANLSHIVHVPNGADVHRGDQLGGDLPSDVPDGARLRAIVVLSNSRDTYLRVECEIEAVEEVA